MAALTFAGVRNRGRLSSWSIPARSDGAVEWTAPKSDTTYPPKPSSPRKMLFSSGFSQA